jgi:hypothetical protein
MEKVIIGVTVFLGAGLIIVAVVALFRRGQSTGGSLELPFIKLTATSAPALFLVVGAAMVLSGFAWASTDKKKTEAVRDVARFQDAYRKQQDVIRQLVQRAPAASNDLPADQRALIKGPALVPSPRIKAEIERLPPIKP